MRPSALAILITFLLDLSRPLWAYDVLTHEEMSERAMRASNLARDPELLKSLGVRSLQEEQKFPNSRHTKQTISNLFRDGARFEDNGSRATNHFYDPLRNRPLSVPLLSTRTSPDWALEDTAVVDKQEFSYRDARGYFGRHPP